MTLEDSILQFIKDNNLKNSDVDSEDIILQFQKKTDHITILKAVTKLQEEGKIQRKWLGSRYGYIAIGNDKEKGGEKDEYRMDSIL